MIEINDSWDWHSHLSVLNFFVNEYDIAYCVEHGTGIHSTPLLIRGSRNYAGYEEAPEWRLKMIEEGIYPEQSVSDLETPTGMTIFERYSDLSDGDKIKMASIYADLFIEVQTKMLNENGFKLLFVDGFTASRNVCINALYPLFDIIVIHDTEPGSEKKQYEYNFCDEINENFTYLKVTTPVPYTGVLVRNNITVDFDKLRTYMDEYCDMLGWDYNKMDILIS